MSGKIEYMIVCSWEHDGLMVEVKGWIDYGWEPQGGLSIALNDHGADRFYQAMTRKVSNKESKT